MSNLNYLILEDGSQVEIPVYVSPSEDVEAEENCFLVDLADPLSIAAILKYQIENWDSVLEKLNERAGDGEEDSIAYGTMDDEGEFESLCGFVEGETNQYGDTLFYYCEEAFAKAAVSFPQLLPLLEEYAKLVVEASRDETTGGPWATEETVFGQFLLPELAMYDKKYVYLLEDFAVNVEVRFSAGIRQEYLMSLYAVYEKWGITHPVLEVSTLNDKDCLGEGADLDKLLQALSAEKSRLNAEEQQLIDTFLAERKQFGHEYLHSDHKPFFPGVDKHLAYYAFDVSPDRNAGLLNLSGHKYVCFKLSAEKKTFLINTIGSEQKALSLSDDFYALAKETFKEAL